MLNIGTISNEIVKNSHRLRELNWRMWIIAFSCPYEPSLII
jgi:hypothetical protein